MFILYHLLYNEGKLASSIPGLLPLENIQLRTHIETVNYRSLTANTQTSSAILNNGTFIISEPNEFEAEERDASIKFLFVLHHYEQLSKTTENLLQLAAVAKQIERVIVEPFVRDSRMCGLPYGWSGKLRSERRRFHPLSLYFDVKFMNNLLKKYHIAPMVKLETFKRQCRSRVTHTTIIHFLYSDQSEEEMKKWYKISALEYQDIKKQAKSSGWCECKFIEHALSVSNRIGELRIGRQICVDAEKVSSLELFEKEITKGDKCVVVIHWRGIGKDRTHFKPEVEVDNRKLLHSLRSSERVAEKATKIRDSIGGEYISIHIRSERQIQWYDVERLAQCVRTLVKKVESLKQKYNKTRVFLSSDFTRFGSDTLHSFTAQNTSLVNKLKQIKRFLYKALKPLKYNPKSGDPLDMDSGVVALTEMNVLTGGSHLVTIGSGNFQQWIVDGFVERKAGTEQQNNWTITRICNKEDKVNDYKPR